MIILFHILLLFHIFALGSFGTDKALLCALQGPQSFSYQVNNKLTLWYFFGVWAVAMDYSSQKSPVSYICLYAQVLIVSAAHQAANLGPSRRSLLLADIFTFQFIWPSLLKYLLNDATLMRPDFQVLPCLALVLSFGRVGWMHQPVLLLLSKTWGRYLDIIFGAFPQILAFSAFCSQLWSFITDSGTIGENAT